MDNEEEIQIENKKEFIKQVHTYLKEKGNYISFDAVISINKKEPIFTDIEIKNVGNTEIARMIALLEGVAKDLKAKYPIAAFMSNLIDAEEEEI